MALLGRGLCLVLRTTTETERSFVYPDADGENELAFLKAQFVKSHARPFKRERSQSNRVGGRGGTLSGSIDCKLFAGSGISSSRGAIGAAYLPAIGYKLYNNIAIDQGLGRRDSRLRRQEVAVGVFIQTQWRADEPATTK